MMSLECQHYAAMEFPLGQGHHISSFDTKHAKTVITSPAGRNEHSHLVLKLLVNWPAARRQKCRKQTLKQSVIGRSPRDVTTCLPLPTLQPVSMTGVIDAVLQGWMLGRECVINGWNRIYHPVFPSRFWKLCIKILDVLSSALNALKKALSVPGRSRWWCIYARGCCNQLSHYMSLPFLRLRASNYANFTIPT